MKTDWNPIQKAEQLKVRAFGETRQFAIEGMSAGREWDERYVEFSGYFGSYGPEMFSAAPELLEALTLALPFIDTSKSDGAKAMKLAQAAISKAAPPANNSDRVVAYVDAGRPVRGANING